MTTSCPPGKMGLRNDEEEIDAMDAWTGHPWGAWFLFFPILWIGLVVLAFVAVRGGWGRRSQDRGSAEAILGERFARGEISGDEYRERLAVLKGRSRA
jgi:putative membrane protein